jgi:uncharacterized protein YqeY
MSLHERITEDMKAAMRAKESARLSAIRLLLAALKQKQVDERASGKESAALGDPDVLAIIDKMIKQRRESIAQFEKAGRSDLVAGKSSKSTCCRLICRNRSGPRRSSRPSALRSPSRAPPASRTWAR